MPLQAAPKRAGKKTEKSEKKALVWSEKYDVTRQVGPDPRDPRTTGPPCDGQHQPAAAYRGSVTGSNGHTAWIGCERCKLRLSYTPAYGAHGMTRSPGPLPKGSFNSLLEKLEHVRDLKKTAYVSNKQAEFASRSEAQDRDGRSTRLGR